MSRLTGFLLGLLQYGLALPALILGILTIFMSAQNLSYLPIGLGFCGIAAIVMPPSRRLVERGLKRPFKLGELALIIAGLFFGPTIAMSLTGPSRPSAQTNQSEKAQSEATASASSPATRQEDPKTEFLKEKQAILDKANKLFQQRKHDEAMALLRQYDQWEDKDLLALATRAEAAERARREGELANQRRLQAERQESERISWQYQTAKDEMSNQLIHYATLQSVNGFEFGFPYGGQQHATLTVRKHPRWGIDLYLEIERGQFACMGTDCTASLRFDNDGIIMLGTHDSASYDPKLKFIDEAEALIHRIQLSRSLMIEASFYNEGTRTFEFRTEGYVAR